MLTEHQQDISSQAISILDQSNRLIIQGSAGVGKTYLVGELVKVLKKRYNLVNSSQIYCSAPTHKAVGVLKGKVDSSIVTFITVHSALKMKRKVDRKTGKKTYEPDYHDKYPPLKGVKLWIIDEASMVSTHLLLHIERHASLNGCRVIFIGDNKQLNPVLEFESPVFMGMPRLVSTGHYDSLPEGAHSMRKYDDESDVVYGEPYPMVELTEIIRQGEGNPIIHLSRNLTDISNKVDIRNDTGGFIYSDDEEKIIETLAVVNGTDKLKYLAYDNATVDRINKQVREKIYTNPAKIEKGETIVFDEPFGDFFTNEEVFVKDVLIREKLFDYMNERVYAADDKYDSVKLKYYSINPVVQANVDENWNNIEGEIITDKIIVIHEESEEILTLKIKELNAKAVKGVIPWIEFYTFEEQFAKIKYNHALTIHKS